MIVLFIIAVVVFGVALAGVIDHFDGNMAAARAGKPRRRGCTCAPEFFPVAVDIECPTHGLATFLRERLEADAQRERVSA